MRNRETKLLKLIPLELILVSVIFLLALFSFSFIVHYAVYQKEDVFDKQLILYFSAHDSPEFIAAMKRISFFGSTNFLLPAYLVLIAWLITKKKNGYAIDIGIIAVSSTAMLYWLKSFFHRHRPAFPVIEGVSGYSFPSGHSLSSFIFFTILIFLVWKGALAPAWKYMLMSVLLVCPLIIGLSRIVLNVHYATDVIGGFCLALVWVILSFAILKKIRGNNTTGHINTIS